MSEGYVLFKIRDIMLATDREQVTEIIDIDAMVNTNRESLKATVYDGEVIPVIDPQESLFIRRQTLTRESKILVFQDSGENFGILVDSLEGIEIIDAGEIKKPKISDKNYVKGRYNDVGIIDLKVFLDEDMEEDFKTLRENDVDISFDSSVKFDEIDFGANYAKKEIQKDLINFILNKKEELSNDQIQEITEIQRKIEGL